MGEGGPCLPSQRNSNMPRFLLPAISIALLLTAILYAKSPPPVPADTLSADLAIDKIPLGLETRIANKENPLTTARVALGRRIFFDPILSHDKTVACASCHRPDHGLSTPDARPIGIGGKTGTRKAPTLFNRAYGRAFFWDGRAKSLEEQALEPIANPVELGSSVAEAVNRLKADSTYKDLFARAFDDGVTAKNLGKAIASFERVLLRGDSSIDRFRERGDRAR